jgi:hypothetical protein
VLHVFFMESNNESWNQRGFNYAKKWEAQRNIQLRRVYNANAAEIRVTYTGESFKSKVGTTCLNVGQFSDLIPFVCM